jgi:hypothetical protein
MKLLYLFLLVLPSNSIFTDADPIDKVAGLIKRGDAHELSKSFSSTIELIIMDQGDLYSKTQAELILSDFFNRNQPRSVRILHRISSNSNYRFAVLILTTYNGVYRTSFSLKNTNGQFEINELRIETEKAK